MDHLVDTNMLLRSVERTHALHQQAVAALGTLLSSGETVYFTSQNIIEFWNTCTRPLDRNGLGLSPNEADAEVSRLEGLLTLLPDDPSVYPEWRRLVGCNIEIGIAGNPSP